MKIDYNKIRIYVKPGYIDMRKQINALSVYVEESLNHNPLSGDLYIFCGKSRRTLKILYWDRNGFCMWQKRLEQDKFPWPLHEEEVKEITEYELSMLLDGINFWNAHKVLKFSAVS
jgi:transposase